MNQIIIKACVTTYPDGSSKTRIRKAFLDETGHLIAKYFLTNYGEWIQVPSNECLPGVCALETAIYEQALEE